MKRAMEWLSLAPDLLRVLTVLPQVEFGRRRVGPKPLLASLRRRGMRSHERDAAARARLQRAIAGIDRRFPDGGNCYRRALLAIALDYAAAAQPFRMGFRSEEGAITGHAWLGDTENNIECYEAEFTL